MSFTRNGTEKQPIVHFYTQEALLHMKRLIDTLCISMLFATFATLFFTHKRYCWI